MTACRVAVVVAALCAACRGELVRPAGGGEPVRTARAERGDVFDRQLLTGELRAASSTPLTVPRTDFWQLTVRWLAEDGVMVKAGDKVLEFDNTAVTSQMEEKRLGVIEAEMTLHAAQDLAAIETAGKATELRQHEIALEKATAKAEVPADLLAGRDAQERQLEKKRAEVARAKAEHELAAQRDQAGLELHIKQVELDKAKRGIEAAEQTIRELVLVAPRDGLFVVEDHPWLGRRIRAGDTVQPGMTVASLPDMAQAMEVRAELSDVDDGRIAVGMAGTCTLDAFPGDAIACKVKDITPVARTKGEGSLRRTFAVMLDLGKADARMRPGMSVKIELPLRAQPGAVVVPRGAIVATSRGPQVRLATGELRSVTLGTCSAQACAAEGIAAGEAVLVGGAP